MSLVAPSSLAVAAALAFAGIASAQDRPARSPFELPPAYNQPAAKPVAPIVPLQPQGVLTGASLGALLDQLGYEHETDLAPNHTEYTITVHRPKCTVRATIFITNDRPLICFGTRLPTDLDPRLPGAAARTLALLQKNVDIAPAMFAADKDGRLWLLTQTPNSGITPARFRETLDRYLSAVEETMPLWESPRHPAAGNPSANDNVARR
jgi:hypothetical protein